MNVGRRREGFQTGMVLVLLALAVVGIVLSFPIKMGSYPHIAKESFLRKSKLLFFLDFLDLPP